MKDFNKLQDIEYDNEEIELNNDNNQDSTSTTDSDDAIENIKINSNNNGSKEIELEKYNYNQNLISPPNNNNLFNNNIIISNGNGNGSGNEDGMKLFKNEFTLQLDNNGSELNESDFITSMNDSGYITPFSQYIKGKNHNIYEKILETTEKYKIKADMHKSELILTSAYLFCFVALGISVGSLGPTLHSFKDHLNASADQVGYFFSARGLGYFVFSLGCRFLDRVKNTNYVIAASVVLMSISLLLIPVSTNIWLTAFLFILAGGGAGLIDSSLNTLICWVWNDKVNPFMQLLHFSFGIGAFLAPLIISTMTEKSLFTQYLVLSMIMLSSSLTIVLLKPAKPPTKQEVKVVDENDASILLDNDGNNTTNNNTNININNAELGGNEIQTIPKSEKRLGVEVIFAIAIFLFFYVGGEVGFGGWVCTYSMNNLKFSEKAGALINSAFWASFTAGRLAGVFVSLVLSPHKMVIIDTLGCFLFTSLIIAFPGSSSILWIGTIGLGISLASIFPTAFSLPQNLNIPVTGESTSYMVIGAVAGEIVIPWTIGMLQSSIGSHILPWVVLFSLLVSLIIYIAINLRAIQVRSKQKGQNVDFSFNNSILLLNQIVNNNNNNKD